MAVDLMWKAVEDDDGEVTLNVGLDVDPVVVLVEGPLAATLSEVNGIIEDFKDFLTKERAKDPTRLFKETDATYHAVRYSVENGYTLCKTAEKGAIRPKQNDCLILMKEFINRLALNKSGDDSFDNRAFITDCIDWMSATHFCLLEQVKRSDRRVVKRAFKANRPIPFIESSVEA